MEALELLGVELRGQRNIARQALQLLQEIPALRQRHASAAPAHLDAGLRRGLLADRGDQAVVLDLRLKWRNEAGCLDRSNPDGQVSKLQA